MGAVFNPGTHTKPDDSLRRPIGLCATTGPSVTPEKDPFDAARQLKLVRASSVVIEPIRFLLPNRIPEGDLTLAEGDGDLGKTTALLDLGARLTVGGELPDGSPSGSPCNVLVIAVEDNLSVLTARLTAAGADLKRISFVTGMEDPDGNLFPFEVPTHGAELVRAIKGTGARFVYLDSLFDSFAEGLDPNKARDCRKALRPIREAAHATGAAIVATRHHNKNRASAAHRGSGSSDLRNVARAVVTFVRDPDDPDLRLMRNSKNNLGRDVDALTYRLLPTIVQSYAGEPVEVARVVWCGTKVITADEAVSAASDPENSSPIAEAEDFLRKELADGPVSACVIQQHAKNLNIAERTLKRAKKTIGVLSVKGDFKGGGWAWALPPKGATDPQECHNAVSKELAPFDETGPPSEDQIAEILGDLL